MGWGRRLLGSTARTQPERRCHATLPLLCLQPLPPQGLPLGKLPSFGGKLGAELAELGAGTAGEAAALPRDALLRRFGPERTAWILQAVSSCFEIVDG